MCPPTCFLPPASAPHPLTPRHPGDPHTWLSAAPSKPSDGSHSSLQEDHLLYVSLQGGAPAPLMSTRAFALAVASTTEGHPSVDLS